MYLLISPECKSAYFNDLREVASAELRSAYPSDSEYIEFGELKFFKVTLESPDFKLLSRLSFVQGIFELNDDGSLKPVKAGADFFLDERFVFGTKYKGKTNERLTQLLLNLAMLAAGKDLHEGSSLKLLDPMCGRGTTLFWAARYGMHAKGIEQHSKALDDIELSAKKWRKVCEENVSFKKGFVGPKQKSGEGRFLELGFTNSSLKFIQGKSENAEKLLSSEKFHLIVSDLPYGVEYLTQGARNPLQTIEACIPRWKASLKPDGIVALSYNKYIPKRRDLIAAFETHGFEALEFSAPHRMSESIVRDILLLKNS